MFRVFTKKKEQMFVGMNYINGEWIPHRPDFSSLNPCDEFELGMFPITDRPDVAEAVDSARCAFNSWRHVSRVQRSDYFDKLSQLVKRDHDKLVRAISLETGKSLNESHAEVIESLHMCQVVAGSGRFPCGDVMSSELNTKDSYIMRKPKGVVAVISPWNFPLAIGSFWSTAPAIVEGNCVVHKPSEYTPMVAQLAAELYEEAGFPSGVYNLIHGMDNTGKELVSDNGVDCILFTGSAEVGREIRIKCAETWHKSCSCEMGSKSAVIVFEDADLNLALDACLASAFKLSGQRCVSSGRMIIHRNIFDKFRERFVDAVNKNATTGNPFDVPVSYYGPIINSDQMKRVMSYNEKTLSDTEAKVLIQGKRQGDKGYFLTPHVYETEWGNKSFLKEEVFGPHVALIPFDTVDDAIRIYNDTDYGLALGVITEDFRTMRRCRDECDTGMLYLNGGSIAAESQLKFGGVKKSGNGWKSAAGTYEAVTEEIAVTMNYEHGISWAQGMT